MSNPRRNDPGSADPKRQPHRGGRKNIPLPKRRRFDPESVPEPAQWPPKGIPSKGGLTLEQAHMIIEKRRIRGLGPRK